MFGVDEQVTPGPQGVHSSCLRGQVRTSRYLSFLTSYLSQFLIYRGYTDAHRAEVFWSDVCAFQFGLGVIVSPAKPNLACHEASRAVEFVVHATMFQKTNFRPTRD